jgi:glutamyl/glutaminyl-tRNA synthetase
MEITHVIRSQEFIPSVPKFLNLYEALEIIPPIFATPPPVLNPDNNRKLSKREGAKQVLDYKTMGILPDAMVNTIVSLGWNDGTTDEFYTRDQLIDKFDINRLQKSGAHFSEDRLFWVSGHYIRNLNNEQLYEQAKTYLPETSKKFDKEYCTSALGLIKERLKYFAEIPVLTNYFFEDLPIDLKLIKDNKILGKLDISTLIELLKTSKTYLESSSFKLSDLVDSLNQLLVKTGQPPKVLFSLIRIATTNSPSSPALADTMNLIGKEKSLAQIDNLINYLVKLN